MLKKATKTKRYNKGYERYQDMVSSKNAILTLLTKECKNGFVCRLFAPDLGLKLPGISESLTSAIVKFVVTSPLGNDSIGNEGKQTMKPVDVLKEAQSQEETYLGGIQGGRPPICPGILGLFFLNNLSAKAFLKNSQRSSHLDAKAKDVMRQLFTYIDGKSNFGIAAVVMENVDRSQTLSDFLTDIRVSEDDKKEVLAILLAHVTRMALILGIAHFDLHPGNVLVKLGRDGKYEVFIIDFGLSGEIGATITDSQEESQDVERDPNIELTEIEEQFPLLSSKVRAGVELTREEILEIMKSIINLLEAIDRHHLRTKYPHWYRSRGSTAQMESWTQTLTDEIILNAFRKFNEMHSVQDVRLSRDTLDTYVREGKIPDLSQPLESYYVTLCGPSSAASSSAASSSALSGCSVMGGKRKSKKHKKSKISKKIKKSRKTRKIRNKYKNKN
jgi:tRNA A-37 threonylcarbamoyl transferase component Bud32